MVTVVTVGRPDVRQVSVTSLMQGQEWPRPAPPRLPARRRRPEEVAARLTVAVPAAVTLSVNVAAAGAGVERVDAGGVRTVAVVQLGGGRVGQRGAGPRAALLRLRPLRLEAGTLEQHGPVSGSCSFHRQPAAVSHHYVTVSTL